MYRVYLSGSGGPGIARELNRRGIPNDRGKPWNAKTVRDIPDTEFGAGLLRRVPVDADGNKITAPFPQMRWVLARTQPSTGSRSGSSTSKLG